MARFFAFEVQVRRAGPSLLYLPLPTPCTELMFPSYIPQKGGGVEKHRFGKVRYYALEILRGFTLFIAVCVPSTRRGSHTSLVELGLVVSPQCRRSSRNLRLVVKGVRTEVVLPSFEFGGREGLGYGKVKYRFAARLG